MNKKYQTLLIAIISVISLNAEYIMHQKINSGIGFSQQTYPSSCLEIINNDNSATSNYYNLTIAGETIKTHCDMDIDGGGWTMIQTLHDEVSTFTDSTNFEIDNNNNTFHASLPDNAWAEIKSNSTTIMMVNASNYSHYMQVSIIKAESANCKPLGNTLKTFGKIHHENSGCGSSGTDYSLFGGRHSGAASNLYGYSGYYDYKSFSGWVKASKSYIYIK